MGANEADRSPVQQQHHHALESNPKRLLPTRSEECLRELAEASAELVLQTETASAMSAAPLSRSSSPGLFTREDDPGPGPSLNLNLSLNLNPNLTHGFGGFGGGATGLGQARPTNSGSGVGSAGGGSAGMPTPRPEWQKICIQHSVCIHNIYGNCAYGVNCYYNHLEGFGKPDLLFKTELCRYGVDCVNRTRCCFAHSQEERRTPEVNMLDALANNNLLGVRASNRPGGASRHVPPHHHHHAAAHLGGPHNMFHLPAAPLPPLPVSPMHVSPQRPGPHRPLGGASGSAGVGGGFMRMPMPLGGGVQSQPVYSNNRRLAPLHPQLEDPRGGGSGGGGGFFNRVPSPDGY